jgi:hypothetical protein
VAVIGAVIFLLARPARSVRHHLGDAVEPSGAVLADHRPAD